MSTVNHLKKNESLDDKQLIIVNSDNKDFEEQSSSSFTYTFNEPVERVSKIDMMYCKIPNTFYNVNSDKSTMSITVQTFDETKTFDLVIDDSELKNNTIASTNLIDGSLIKTNLFESVGNSNVNKVFVKNTFVYCAGDFSSGNLDIRDFTGTSAGNILNNEGLTDLFVAQFNLEQTLQWRLKIGGLSDDSNIDIASTNSYLSVVGTYTSSPLIIFDKNDYLVDSLISDTQPTVFLVTYDTSGNFQWCVNIEGMVNLTNPIKIIIDEVNDYVYVSGTFSRDLVFYNKEHSTTPVRTITNTDSNKVFIAQYTLSTGILNWASKIENNCILKTLSFNNISLNPIFGIEFTEALNFYDSVDITDNSNDLEIEGSKNLAVIEYDKTGNIVDRFKIGGTLEESNIRISTNLNKMAIAGTYSSNPLKFYSTNDIQLEVQNIEGNFNNLFIAYFDLETKNLIWSSNIYDQSNNIDNLDIGITSTDNVIILGSYSTILKFNSTGNVYAEGADLSNTDSVNYLFIAKYDSNGIFQNRTYIKSTSSGSINNYSIDATSNTIFVSGSFSGSTASIFNPNNDVTAISTITNSSPSITKGLLLSFINNVDNFSIDDNKIDKRLICRPLSGTDLNYTMNLNSFSQEIGLVTSQKFRAMIFGSNISWDKLNIDNTNDTLTIVFNIGNLNEKRFSETTINFKITQSEDYTPYNLAFELSKVIKRTLQTNSVINDTNIDDSVVYYKSEDSSINIFYIIFGINGTFKIVSNNLTSSLGMNLPNDTSPHCIITDDNVVGNTDISISDDSKISIKLQDEIIEQHSNNVDFNTAFPNAASGSVALDFRSISGQKTKVFSNVATDSIGSDFKVNDEITFDSPWVNEDINNTSVDKLYDFTGCVISSDGNILVTVAKDSRINFSINAGSNWFNRQISRKWNGIDMSYDGTKITAIVEDGNIYTSFDYGNTWNIRESLRKWSSISISKTNGIFQTAVVYGGKIYISSDSGNSWSAKGSNLLWVGVSISNDGQYQTAVDFKGYIYISTDFGQEWTSTGIINEWMDVAVSQNGDIQIAVNRNGSIFKSTDFGSNWSEIQVNRGQILSKISMSADAQCQTIVGDMGNIYYSSDFGNTWFNTGLYENWGGIAVSQNGNYQLSAVKNGGVYYSSDFGNTWTEFLNSFNWYGVSTSSDGRIILASNYTSNPHISKDYGNSWSSITSIISSWYDTAMSDNGKYINISGSLFRGAYISNDYGETFIFNQFNIERGYVDISSNGKYQIFKSSNNLYISSDYGITWETKNITGDYSSMSKTGKYIITDNYLSSNYGNDFTLSVQPGTGRGSLSADGKYQMILNGDSIFNSSNYGIDWESGVSVTNSLLLSDMSSDGKYRIVCSENKDYLYISNDFGITWSQKCIQKKYKGVTMSSDGSTQYASALEDNIYKSTNFGITWIKVNQINSNIDNKNLWACSAISNSGKYSNIGVGDGNMKISTDTAFTYNNVNPSVPIRKFINNIRHYNINSDISGTGQYQVTIDSDNVYGSNDFGITWSATSLGTNFNQESCVAISEDGLTIIAVGNSNSIRPIKTHEGAWPISFTDSAFADLFTHCCMTPDASVRYVISRTNIYRYSSSSWDSGTNFSSITNGISEVVVIDTDATGNVILIGCDHPNYKLYFSTNNIIGPFIEVTYFPSPTINLTGNERWASVKVSPDGQTFAAVVNSWVNRNRQNIWVSTDGGANWYPRGSKRNWCSMNMSQDGTKLIATEYNGNIHYSFNGGTEWQSQNSNINAYKIDATQFLITNKISSIVSKGEFIYTSIDNGINYERHPFYNNWRNIEVSSTDGSRITAIPHYGKILSSLDTGNSWILTGPLAQWNGISMSSDGINQSAVAYGDHIYISTDSGLTWSIDTNDPGVKNWIDIKASNDNTIRIAIEENGDIWKSDSSISGGAWLNTTTPSGGPYKWKGVDISINGTHHVAFNNDNTIFKSDDSGVTWDIVDTKVNDIVRFNNISGKFNNEFFITDINSFIYYNSINGFKSINTIKGNWSDIIFKLSSNYTIANGVLYEFSGGLNLSKIPLNKSIISFDMTNDGFIQILAIQNGFLYVSDNKGESFTRINIVKNWKSVSVSGNTGQYMIAVAYDDYIYYSNDTGQTFNIHPNTLTIGVTGNGKGNWHTCDISDDGNYQIVGGVEDYIYYSNDTGLSWSTGTLLYSDKLYLSISSNGQYVTIVSGNRIRHSIDGGISFNFNFIYKDLSSVSVSGNGRYQLVTTSNDLLYRSEDFGATFNAVISQPARNWNSSAINNDGSVQLVSVDDGLLYYSKDYGINWTEAETNRGWVNVAISSNGLFQIACDNNNIISHSYALGQRLTLNVETIASNNTINDSVVFKEIADNPIDLIPLHNSFISEWRNFSIIRKIPSNLTDIFIPPNNYTGETLKNVLNALILSKEPSYVDPFSFDETFGKFSFTPKYSGEVIGLTPLLKRLGIIEIPNPATAGQAIIATSVFNPDVSGPLNLFIKSDVIGSSKKHKTAFSTNKKIENIIAPLELDTNTNTYRIPLTIEIFLSKKETFNTIDIQIVDEQGNIVNLNGGVVQANMYFISS